MKPTKIIVVFCHSRAKLLQRCLSSIVNAEKFSGWKLIVVHQKGYNDVDKVLAKYKKFIDIVISINPKFDFPLGNINNNRIIGTKIGFDFCKADYLLGVEEDNLISKDALNFIDFACKKYEKNNSFRGVNLGSLEYGKSIGKEGYSLLRFGLHGSAGVLTKKTWKEIKKKKLWDFDLNDDNCAWDAKIEFYLKTGFMVTPNLSRNLDLGYGGSFAPASKSDPYFSAIRKSWFIGEKRSNIKYMERQINHKWRRDAVEFKEAHSIIYFFRTKNFMINLSKYLRLTKVIKKSIM